jgi:hypothetical protein
MRNRFKLVLIVIVLGCAAIAIPAAAQTVSPQFDLSRSRTELLRKINRRISDISTVPFESSLVHAYGQEHRYGYKLNVEPVIPFSLGQDWLVLTRFDVPVVYKEQVSSGTSLGLADTKLTFLFATEKPRDGWMWGFGQLWLIPTATRTDLGSDKWGAGLTSSLVHEGENWTVGARLDHVWSFAGTGTNSLNDSFLNPWITRAWENGVTLKLESETTYKWSDTELSVPVEFGASKLLMSGNVPLSIGGDVMYWAKRAPNDPQWGLKFTLNLIFSKTKTTTQ